MTDSPIRIAIIGAGPSGFFLAEKLLHQSDQPVTVDLYERLPTPYGLVRFGVAPDHEKIKNVTRTFDKTAGRPGFRFWGNVDIGRTISLDELRAHYHAVCFTTGAPSDRQMGIPGEDLRGSHPATEFVAWYNGHPEYRHFSFDLSVERVAVVGVGNVAVDVARILSRTPEELAKTDIAPHALEALRHSRVREIYLLGRRGPAQAAFTNPEVKELGELDGADVACRAEEVALDPLSAAELEQADDAATRKKIDILADFAGRTRSDKPRCLTLRFLVSPTEITGDDAGRVAGMTLGRNRLVEGKGGALRAEATGETETLEVGLVFRSVGYRGVEIPGLPFDERSGTVPNEAGRVTDHGVAIPGLYVAGWIKRGPNGVIGTNKPDAGETADSLLADAASGVLPHPEEPATAIETLIRGRQPDLITWHDWERINQRETETGKADGRPRTKLVTVEAMLAAARAELPIDATRLRDFATRYTSAWGSQDAARVASFFAEHGSLKINEGDPSVGRAAITAAAQGFMTALPDMVLTMDAVDIDRGRVVYRWSLAGTNTGPHGTGNAVRISGCEEWTIGDDGLIVRSLGHFDSAEYDRQLTVGIAGPP